MSRVEWLDLFSDHASLDSVVEAFHYHVSFFYNVFFTTKTVRFRAFEPPWMKSSL